MLVNNSLSEGIFPEWFKTAKVIATLKYADLNSTVEYIPIFRYPFLSKIIEKFMFDLTLARNRTTFHVQISYVGFPRNTATSDAMIKFLDYVYSSLASKQIIIALYL